MAQVLSENCIRESKAWLCALPPGLSVLDRQEVVRHKGVKKQELRWFGAKPTASYTWQQGKKVGKTNNLLHNTPPQGVVK